MMQQKIRADSKTGKIRGQIVNESSQLALDIPDTLAVSYGHRRQQDKAPNLSFRRVVSLLTSVKTLSLSARSKKEEALQKVISKIREAQGDYAQTGAKKTTQNKK